MRILHPKSAPHTLIPISSLLAVAFFCAPQLSSAQSTIVHVAGPVFESTDSENSLGGLFNQSIDMNSDGSADFSFVVDVPICTMDIPTSMCSQDSWLHFEASNSLLTEGGILLVLEEGELIGAETAPQQEWEKWSTPEPEYLSRYENRIHVRNQWWSERRGTSGTRGPIAENNGSGYVGVRLSSEDGDHYGWILIIENNIAEWAYESQPNTPIRAGDRGIPIRVPKPEPTFIPVAVTHTMLEDTGSLKLIAETEPGELYQVQTKENITQTEWMPMGEALGAQSTSLTFTVSMTPPKAFFRVVEFQ